MNLFNVQGTHNRIVIQAPGPSLTKEQVQRTRGIFCITIGDAYLLNPWADILYHGDAKWWRHHNGVPEFYGACKVSLEPVPEYPNVKQLLQSRLRTGLEVTPPGVVSGSNSGYQALNLAYHFRPKEIILLGYNLGRSPEGIYSVRGDSPRGLPETRDFSRFISNISGLAECLASRGVKVYNCTENSALTCFPRRNLDDIIGA